MYDIIHNEEEPARDPKITSFKDSSLIPPSERRGSVYSGFAFPPSSSSHSRSLKKKESISLFHYNEEQTHKAVSLATPAAKLESILMSSELSQSKVHPLFTQMATLWEGNFGDMAWKETARWLKYEEDVESGGERWSKPYVATLSLHSLFALRKIIQKGTVMLDMDAHNMNQIADLILDQIINKGVMPYSNWEKGNKQFLRKIPAGAEAANILVGETFFLEHEVAVFIRLRNSVILGSVTEVLLPTRFIFIVLGPKGELSKYHEIGRSVATLLSDEVFREVAYKSTNRTHLLAGIDEFLDAVTALPPGTWDPAIRIEPPSSIHPKRSREVRENAPIDEMDEEEEERKFREACGLVRSGRLFGGLINDVKRKLPWYISDFKDGISFQTVASFSFLYFACLAPIITFGGLLSEATGKNLGAMESLLSGLICGVVYGLFSGQPLTILGSTGPVLVFEDLVYRFCQSAEWQFLSFRLWVGIWCSLILLLLVAYDLSAYVCYITRFTEENFAMLIAIIFIYKAVEKVIKIGSKYPMEINIDEDKWCNCSLPQDSWYNYSYFDASNSTITKECLKLNGTFEGNDCQEYYPDIFLFSIILCCATFIISSTLKDFKTTSFFPTVIRQLTSDFAVTVAISSMTFVDYCVGIHTPKLEVPSEFKPTLPNRGWIVTPFNGNPWWTCLAAIIPACLACILLFMDQQITAVIVNRKEHKLKKGGGYHLDLFILSFLTAVNSVLGIPWFVAGTVLCLNHVNSLRIESETLAPGEKPEFLGVRENRLTNVLIFAFIGLSTNLTGILQLIPMPVLFGVFLYMGTSVLNGIQFYHRILIMFMPQKFQPDLTVLRKLVVMVGIRKALDWVFTQEELKILDDVLPEFTRHEKLDMEEQEMEEEPSVEEDSSGKQVISVQLSSGVVIRVPHGTGTGRAEHNSTGVLSAAEGKNIPKKEIYKPTLTPFVENATKEKITNNRAKKLEVHQEDEIKRLSSTIEEDEL